MISDHGDGGSDPIDCRHGQKRNKEGTTWRRLPATCPTRRSLLQRHRLLWTEAKSPMYFANPNIEVADDDDDEHGLLLREASRDGSICGVEIKS